MPACRVRTHRTRPSTSPAGTFCSRSRPPSGAACATIETLALGSLGSNPFPDSTPDFFQKLEHLLNLAMGGQLKLIRPFAHLHKADVLLRGKDLPLHLTFSCISPVLGQHCGACNKCTERKKGFADAGIPDNTIYHR